MNVFELKKFKFSNDLDKRYVINYVIKISAAGYKLITTLEFAFTPIRNARMQ